MSRGYLQIAIRMIVVTLCAIGVETSTAQQPCDAVSYPGDSGHFGEFESAVAGNLSGSQDEFSFESSPPFSINPDTFADRETQWFNNFRTFFGIDGSKQPQDFGANANLGVNVQLGYSNALNRDLGIGYQIGSRAVFQGNAVQVFELLGESKDRFQVFTTAGLFQRMPKGFAWGVAYDFLNQESYDDFALGQWRVRASFDVGQRTEVGVTMKLAAQEDVGQFNDVAVKLEPVEQLHIFIRRHWQTGAITTFWFGIADEHSEENIVTGTLPPKTNQFLFGADLYAPLNNWMALYGETNLIMPADTGAVDAFLGIEFAPGGIRRNRSRSNRFRDYMPVASSVSFTSNLTRR